MEICKRLLIFNKDPQAKYFNTKKLTIFCFVPFLSLKVEEPLS